MRIARHVSEFVRDPVGAMFATPTFVIFSTSPSLHGWIRWDTLRDADARLMLEALGFLDHPALAPRFDVLLDNRAVPIVDREVLVLFAEHVRARLPALRARIRRQAVVVPDGVTGMMLAGMLAALDPQYESRFLPDLPAALAYLDRPEAAAAHAEADALAQRVRGPGRLLRELRDVLARDLAGATVGGAAGALGRSARSLQRELSELGTSFSDELRRARVEAARELLADAELKVEAIAARIGFGTSSRLAIALRRELGVTASELRGGSR